MKLDNIRTKIDSIDDKLISLLAKRFSLVQRVGLIKNINNQAIEDKIREKEILKRVTKQAQKLNIPKEFITRLFQNIISESKNIQSRMKI